MRQAARAARDEAAATSRQLSRACSERDSIRDRYQAVGRKASYADLTITIVTMVNCSGSGEQKPTVTTFALAPTRQAHPSLHLSF